jgi:AraC family transcriptional regulator
MKPGTRSFYQSAVERAVERVTSSLDAALNLEDLAQGAALSPFHFHRIFRGMLGETPLQLHRRLRLERAAWMLIEGDAAVTTIAFDAGYDTHEAFTRAFRTHFGRSPTEFRSAAPDSLTACTSIRLPTRSGIHFDPDPAAKVLILFPTGELKMDIQIEKLPEMHVAAVRHVGPYKAIGAAFQKLTQLAFPAGLFGPQTFVMGIYHDDPETTPETELRADAAISISAGAKLPEGLTAHQIPAGRYARLSHIGSYEGLPNAWGRLMGEWLPQSGERVREGAPLEIYRNDPSRTAPEELHTDLCIPLA